MTDSQDFEMRLQKEQEKLRSRYQGRSQSKSAGKPRLMGLIVLFALVIGFIWIYWREAPQSNDDIKEGTGTPVALLGQIGAVQISDKEEKTDTSSLQLAGMSYSEGIVEVQETKLGPQTRLEEEKAYAALIKGNHKEALLYYQQLHAKYPDYPAYLNNLAFLYERLGQWGNAEVAYKKMLAKDADNMMAQVGLVRVQSHSSPEMALNTLRELRQKSPHKGLLLKMEAKLYFDMGKVGSAITCLEEVRQINPYDLRALYNLALLYKKKGAVQKARRLWQSIGQSLRAGVTDPFLEKQVNHQLRQIDKD